MDWSKLQHAYGNAADVPALLARLAPDCDASVWDDLWSRLCHQGSVYSASFAALPTLLELAERWDPAQRSPLICLAAAILAARDVHVASHGDLLTPVVQGFHGLCQQSLRETGLSTHEFIYLLQAARSLEGDQFWGEELDHLASGEFPGVCPHCGVELYLVIGEFGFFTTAEEWIQRPGSTPGKIERRADVHCTPIHANEGVLPDVGQQLLDYARTARQETVAGWIRCVFGTSLCPACGQRFEVQNAIGNR